jgi:hypothetical protein
MSWIKENKFIAGLSGVTLLLAVILFFIGSLGSKRYDAAQEKFDAAYSEAASFEKQPLYPKLENQTSKIKALKEYSLAFDGLQTSFEVFRPKEIKNIKSEEFTNSLKQANIDIRKAFADSKTAVPDAFFVGFEKYNTSLAAASSTGILQYQLDAMKGIMLAMAESKVTELKNLHRPPVLEEAGQVYAATDTTVARSFPMELTFAGTEKSVRDFISKITQIDRQYLVIRTLRIGNSKKAPPLASDVKFEKATEVKDASQAPGSASDFFLPGETPAVPEETKTATSGPDGKRILAQVLGEELVQVFIRMDLLEFLPAKKLP